MILHITRTFLHALPFVFSVGVAQPTITCINDITEVLNDGKATKDISPIWKKPTSNVNDSQISMTPSNFDPKAVPAGITTVRFVAKNSAGQDSCSVRITIKGMN